MGTSPVSRAMRSTRRTVRWSRWLPPAPWVTDTNAGSSSRNAARVANSRSAPASSLGGKNSKENKGSPRLKRLLVRIAPQGGRLTRFGAIGVPRGAVVDPVNDSGNTPLLLPPSQPRPESHSVKRAAAPSSERTNKHASIASPDPAFALSDPSILLGRDTSVARPQVGEAAPCSCQPVLHTATDSGGSSAPVPAAEESTRSAPSASSTVTAAAPRLQATMMPALL